MHEMTLRTLFSLLLICFAAFVHAHPHNWIDLNSTFILDSDSQLVQIKQRWGFDMYYSLMTHADLLNEFGDEETGLSATAKRMIENLEAYNYFSSLKVDGTVIGLGVPDKYRLFTSKKDGEFILVLEMTFDIEPGVKIENHTLAWQVFDPTYYIAMNHATVNNIEIIGGNATECSRQLKYPEPSDELIDYAQALDRTQKETDGLGANFAETAFITCI